ncbi:MAG: [LysW]-aminoadipate kinase [Melioribacteraceae bacterium]|nr:MAG: [LysW]-aminoadipate kinase [Melioribacteraceae bacterium]
MILIKIGGGQSINVKGIIDDISTMKDEQFIIIHGANAYRDQLAAKLNYEKKIITSVSGYASVFSDDDAIDIQLMAYAGVMNKRIVELAQQAGINAVGLTGLDGRLVQGKRNTGIRVRENNKLKVIRDNSGKPQAINSDFINLLLQNKYLPVVTVPIADEEGKAINSENDDILAVFQSTLKAERIIQFIEAPGFLEDVNDESSLILNMTKEELRQKEEQVDGRIKRKLHALNKLFETSDATVIIADGRTEHPLKDAIENKGTVIK